MPPNTQYFIQSDPYASPPSPYPSYQGQMIAPPPPVNTTIPPNPYTDFKEPPELPARFSRRSLLAGGAIAAAAAGTGLYFIFRGSNGTIPLSMVYSTEKGPWLNAALNAFNKSNKNTLNSKTIQVQLTGLGSVDSQTQILSGQIKPVAWSPASNLEMSRLNYKWQLTHRTAIISTTQRFEPQSLVTSPLVLLCWRERAQKLLVHFHVNTLDWPILNQAFRATSWAELGGQQNWGRVQFGQTVPEKSNSGLLTVTLLAYKYFNEPRSFTPNLFSPSSKYWEYLDVFEQAVNRFGCSSGTYLDDIVSSGPKQADVIATYENLALTSQSNASEPLLIYYPDPNMLSDHPFAVLQGDWVTDEESQAALQFRDFLLARDQQLLALSYGFRPGANTSGISLLESRPDNPFVKYAGLFLNHQPDPVQSLAREPGGDVVDALITGWNQRYSNTFSTLDC